MGRSSGREVLRRFGALSLVIGVVLGAVAMLQSPAFGNAAGDMKIKDPSGTISNDPKVGCAFTVVLFGFTGPGPKTAVVAISTQGATPAPPGGNPVLVTAPAAIVPGSGQNAELGPFKNELATALAAVPADSQGEHHLEVKVTVSDPTGATTKTKVIKATGCLTPADPGGSTGTGSCPATAPHGALPLALTASTTAATATQALFTIDGVTDGASVPVAAGTATRNLAAPHATGTFAYSAVFKDALGTVVGTAANGCPFTVTANTNDGKQPVLDPPPVNDPPPVDPPRDNASVACASASGVTADSATVRASMRNGAATKAVFTVVPGNLQKTVEVKDGVARADFDDLDADTDYSFTAAFDDPAMTTEAGPLCRFRTAQAVVVLPDTTIRPTPPNIGAPAAVVRTPATVVRTPPTVLGVQIPRGEAAPVLAAPGPVAIARTGVDSAVLLTLGVTLVALGALLLVPTRRRRIA